MLRTAAEIIGEVFASAVLVLIWIVGLAWYNGIIQ